jgi:hypothetical protein
MSIKARVKLILGITSPDARWGIFAILFAIPFSLWAFAFSFYSVYQWSNAMNPTIWLISAIVFGVIGLVIFITAILLGLYWIRHPKEDLTPTILSKLDNAATREDIARVAAALEKICKRMGS